MAESSRSPSGTVNTRVPRPLATGSSAQLVQDPLTGRPLDGHARGDVPTTCGCQADDAGEHHEPGEDESPGRR